MQQRYYDPAAGRFLSIDPVTTDANTGGSFNRYNYANNNPYNYIDPDGRDAKWVQKKDGTSNLVIKVFETGKGATAAEMATLKARVEGLTVPTGTSITMEISAKPGAVVNTLNMSPGLNTALCGAAGECVNKLGGNVGHVDSSQTGSSNAGAHEVMHFAGISDKYIEGPADLKTGARTAVASQGTTVQIS